VQILDFLGFERGSDGWWSVPKGLPILQGQRFPSLSTLGKALVRVPDLEDRTRGEAPRRRARKDDHILNKHQMMALRLCIAEGLRDEESVDMTLLQASKEEASPKSSKHSSHGESCANIVGNSVSGTHEIDKVMYEIIHHSIALKYLQALGCRYSSNKYHLPGSSDVSLENQNQLVEYLLDNGFHLLSWKNCTLTVEELKSLELYLKNFHARQRSDSPTGDAFDLMKDTNNIVKYLQAIGVTVREGGTFFIDAWGEEYDKAGIVNKIIKTKDLFTFTEEKSDTHTPRKTRQARSDAALGRKELLALRLWAITAGIPLETFPDPSEVGRPAKLQDDMIESTDETSSFKKTGLPSASRVRDVEEVAIHAHPSTISGADYDDTESGNGGPTRKGDDTFTEVSCHDTENHSPAASALCQGTDMDPCPQENIEATVGNSDTNLCLEGEDEGKQGMSDMQLVEDNDPYYNSSASSDGDCGQDEQIVTGSKDVAESNCLVSSEVDSEQNREAINQLAENSERTPASKPSDAGSASQKCRVENDENGTDTGDTGLTNSVMETDPCKKDWNSANIRVYPAKTNDDGDPSTSRTETVDMEACPATRNDDCGASSDEIYDKHMEKGFATENVDGGASIDGLDDKGMEIVQGTETGHATRNVDGGGTGDMGMETGHATSNDDSDPGVFPKDGGLYTQPTVESDVESEAENELDFDTEANDDAPWPAREPTSTYGRDRMSNPAVDDQQSFMSPFFPEDSDSPSQNQFQAADNANAFNSLGRVLKYGRRRDDTQQDGWFNRDVLG